MSQGSETLHKLLNYHERFKDNFHTRYAAEEPAIPVPVTCSNVAGVARPQALSDAAGNSSSLMNATWAPVNGCSTEPVTVNLDTLTVDETSRVVVFFRSASAIFSEADDAVASLRREVEPQCSIALGSLSAVLFNPSLPLYKANYGTARASLEEYTDRITGIGMPWVCGTLHEAYSHTLEDNMAAGLVNVDITNRELAKSLVRSWIQALSAWIVNFRLPSVADTMCVPYPTDLTLERPKIEKLVSELDSREYRRMLRMVHNTAEAIVEKLCIINVDRFAKAFMRAHPAASHEWLDRAEKLCCAHFMHMMKKYLPLRYYSVGVFYDAGNSMVRYAACPEAVAVGSFLPLVPTNVRHVIDRQEYDQFDLLYPVYHTGKTKTAMARAPEQTGRGLETNDRHDRVQFAYYAARRFLHSDCMIAARRLLTDSSESMHLSYPVAGAQVLLAVMVTRYLFVAHIMPSLVAANTATLLQTIDLGVYPSPSLVLPDSVNDPRATLMGYSRAITLDAQSLEFGEHWTSMLDGGMPYKITAKNPTVPKADDDEPNAEDSSEPIIPRAADDESSSAQSDVQAMHVDSKPKKSPAKGKGGTKRPAESLAEAPAALADDDDSAIQEDDSDDDGDDEPKPDADASKARKKRSHKCKSNHVKSRMRRRQAILIKYTSKKLTEIAELLKLRQTEINTTGLASRETLPGKKRTPGGNSERSQRRTRISELNLPWRSCNSVNFFNMRSMYRIAHSGKLVSQASPAPVGELRHILRTMSTPLPETMVVGAHRGDNLPKLPEFQQRKVVHLDPHDAETMTILYENIKQNTTMSAAAFECDKSERVVTTGTPLYALKQIYMIFLYYNNHCSDCAPQIIATHNRHMQIVSVLAKMFGFGSTGRTARIKVFSVLRTSVLYRIIADYRATPLMKPDVWLANMHGPFLHTSIVAPR